MIGFNWLHETEGQREGDNVGAPLVCMHLRSAMALRQKLLSASGQAIRERTQTLARGQTKPIRCIIYSRYLEDE